MLAQHDDVCTSLKLLYDPATPTFVTNEVGRRDTAPLRVLLQLLHLRKAWGQGLPVPPVAALAAAEEDIAVDGWDDVEEMDDHDEGHKLSEEDWGKMTAIARAVRFLADGTARASVEVILALVLRLHCNGFGVWREGEADSRGGQMSDRGLGCFPSASFFNHRQVVLILVAGVCAGMWGGADGVCTDAFRTTFIMLTPALAHTHLISERACTCARAYRRGGFSCEPNASFHLDSLGCLVVKATAPTSAGHPLYISCVRCCTALRR